MKIMRTNHLPTLSAKEETDICLSCGECCRRYWITVLPKEAARIAKQLKQKIPDFLKERCIILVKLYPKTEKGLLTHPSAFFPKEVIQHLQNSGNDVAVSYFIVPQVVLKRQDRACTFLGKGNLCAIYEDRPKPCSLFPFIAVPGFEENYPFCGLYHKTWKDNARKSDAYFKKIKAYFRQVDTKGFTKLWGSPPKEGILMLGEKQVGILSLDSLEKMLSAKPSKRN